MDFASSTGTAEKRARWKEVAKSYGRSNDLERLWDTLDWTRYLTFP